MKEKTKLIIAVSVLLTLNFVDAAFWAARYFSPKEETATQVIQATGIELISIEKCWEGKCLYTVRIGQDTVKASHFVKGCK